MFFNKNKFNSTFLGKRSLVVTNKITCYPEGKRIWMYHLQIIIIAFVVIRKRLRRIRIWITHLHCVIQDVAWDKLFLTWFFPAVRYCDVFFT